jgi:hypothetical protein
MVILGLLIDLLLASVLFGPAHLTLDLKTHEEQQCVEFNIPKEKWIYNYTHDALGICSRAVGGLAEGCAISDGVTCTIVLPERYNETK